MSAQDRVGYAVLAAAVVFAVGVLSGISLAAHSFGEGAPCPRIEHWRERVILPCEHWDPPAPRIVALERVR
jgi:hypothetical protein